MAERGPCFLGNSLGDHFGERLRRGEGSRGEFLGDDHGDLRGVLRGDALGDCKRDDPFRKGDRPGDLDLDVNRRGDVLLDGDLGDLDLGDRCNGNGDDNLRGENLGVRDLDSCGDLERERSFGVRGRGDFERDDLLGDLDLCGRGDRECEESLGDLPLGDSFLDNGDLFVDDVRFGDLRGDSLGDLGRGEYRNGDLLGGDRYLVGSLGDLLNCLIGDLLGDLLGDFLRDRGLGDNDLRF